ncbi:hypothetical protein JCM6882_005696 [Rhodosporidiobolus microsporus]
MSWNNAGQPRRSAPLINRPSAAAPPPPNPPSTFSGLGGAIAGALGGMGYAAPQGGAWSYGAGQAYGPPGGAGGLPPPPAPPYAERGGYGQGHGGGAYGPPQHYGQNGWNGAAPGYPPQPPPQPAYPPSFYPPSHQIHHSLPPAPAPYASTSSASYPPSLPNRPQTTEDGYTLSGAYDLSASSAPSSFPPGPSRGGPPGKRGRGAGARGGREPVNQGPQIIKCCKEDCTFTGRKKDVREHEEDRHLIYAPGREPKPWSGSLKPLEGAVIEGTGISLDTPEALARWIEERKKRWPSKKVVEEKEKAREQRVAAGLEAPPRERGGRGRGRGRGQADFGGRGRGQGRGGARGGYGGARDPRVGGEEEGERAAKRFKGENGEGEKVRKAEGEVSSSDDSDSDDSSSGSNSSSDSDSDDSDDGDSDDGPPEEESTAKAGADAEGEGERDGAEGGGAKDEGGGKPKKQFQVVCRHWRKGQCALGDEKCPYLHEIPANAPSPLPKRKRPAPPPPAHNPFARPASFSSDPFALLAERDHRHIVSDVLQVIEWLGANDWLKGVEIRPGQVDEESGIEVLAETKVDEEGAGGKIEEVEMDTALEAGGDAAPVSEATATSAPLLSPAKSLTPFPSSLPAKPSFPAPSLPPAPSITSPAPPAPTTAIAAPSAPQGIGLALLADYGSDSEDDEAEDEAVAAALVGGA